MPAMQQVKKIFFKLFVMFVKANSSFIICVRFIHLLISVVSDAIHGTHDFSPNHAMALTEIWKKITHQIWSFKGMRL